MSAGPVRAAPGRAPRRSVLLVAHTGRPRVGAVTAALVDLLRGAGLHALLLDEAGPLPGCDDVERVGADRLAEAGGALDLVLVLGGDGTVLRAAEVARDVGAPLLGVDLGHVGFLADAEPDDLPAVVTAVAQGRLLREERLVLDVEVTAGGRVLARSWALNEVSVEKGDRQRVLEVTTEVDGRPVSSFGGDGVVMSTPTGSTAYAFSAGGPVVWPDVEALVMVPISAHALFARPLVVSPGSVLAVEVAERSEAPGVAWCDGRRALGVPAGSRVQVRRSPRSLVLARTAAGPFTDRLVAKFALPVVGWRGPVA